MIYNKGMKMVIDEIKNNDVSIIHLKGKMAGICEADELHNEVHTRLENKINHIVINMKDVSWIGSLCLGALMREIISARQRNGDVYLASLSQKVQRLFRITKLESVVTIFPTVEEAVSAFHNN
jgi:anti-anti-sigma factor